jgi:peptidoglycan hydrolase-like protein with peptidoglycan-binding domain
MSDSTMQSMNSDMDTLFVGSSGSDIEKLQQKLQEMELYFGPIDGLFGQGVERAVKEFQDSQGFATDGVAGLSTLAALNLITALSETVE